MPGPSNRSLEMMIGGLLEATQNMQRDITEIRRDIKDSDARAALSYEQSEQRAAASRAKMYQKTDELVERVNATESAVSRLNADMTSVKEVTAEVTRWKLMGLGALGVTGMAAAALASLITAYWTDIWRVVRGG
ncbi:mlr9754 (plasmid) [Mesorhizobium japonicum MAFF 303099]|uniref:Mlr9754 protein n=2 Tax=Mesorhizobium japonicum TaxID=2066070 RepID=Q98NT1_RHILO|nr:mlr9754 [Mesorhizobium japonicum MAFF 303099]